MTLCVSTQGALLALSLPRGFETKRLREAGKLPKNLRQKETHT